LDLRVEEYEADDLVLLVGRKLLESSSKMLSGHPHRVKFSLEVLLFFTWLCQTQFLQQVFIFLSINELQQNLSKLGFGKGARLDLLFELHLDGVSLSSRLGFIHIYTQ
jgi:hypothetical protein